MTAGTARLRAAVACGEGVCGPASRVVWEPGLALWVSHRPPDWLESLRGESHDLVSTSCLDGAQVFADECKIRVALARVLHAELTNFIYNRIVHWVPSISSSGEQISGQR